MYAPNQETFQYNLEDVALLCTIPRHFADNQKSLVLIENSSSGLGLSARSRRLLLTLKEGCRCVELTEEAIL
jgi:hypothetical protein